MNPSICNGATDAAEAIWEADTPYNPKNKCFPAP